MIEIIYLDVVPSGMEPIVHVNQFDVGREFRIYLKTYNGGTDITPVPTITINGRKTDNHVFYYDETDTWDGVNPVISKYVVSTSLRYVTIATTEQMTACAGDVNAQLVLTDGSTEGTLNFVIRVQEQPAANGDLSDSDLPAIIAEATEQMERAEAAVQHYPYINSTNKDWMLWDAENEQWLDTGVRAQGIDGTGAVSSVDSVLPDVNGDVPLKWADMSSIDNLAITEVTRTMTSQRVEGSYVFVKADDQLYKVATTIAASGTLTPGTNATAVSVGDVLTQLNTDLTPQDITSEFTINNTYVNTIAVIKTGNVVMIHGTTKSVTVNNLKIVDIPNKYKGKTSGIIRIGLGGNTLNNVYLAATGLAIYANGAYDNNAPAYHFEISYIMDIAT